MTEHYTDSKNDADLWPMAPDVAYEIHDSMVEAQFNAYVWWYIRRYHGLALEPGLGPRSPKTAGIEVVPEI